MKKFLSVFLVITIVLSFSISAFASPDSENFIDSPIQESVKIVDPENINDDLLLPDGSTPDIILNIDEDYLDQLDPNIETILYEETIPVPLQPHEGQATPRARAVITVYARLTVSYSFGSIKLKTKVYSDSSNLVFYSLYGYHEFEANGLYDEDTYDEGSWFGSSSLTGTSKFPRKLSKGDTTYSYSSGEHSSNYGTGSFSRSVVAEIK